MLTIISPEMKIHKNIALEFRKTTITQAVLATTRKQEKLKISVCVSTKCNFHKLAMVKYFQHTEEGLTGN